MDTGANLGAAVMPLSLAARVRRGPNREIIVEPRNSVAALVAKFRGRLFVLGDIDAVPGLTEAERAEFLASSTAPSTARSRRSAGAMTARRSARC